MDKQDLVYMDNEILSSLEKEESSCKFFDMNAP
jgi:hypothetical protein